MLTRVNDSATSTSPLINKHIININLQQNNLPSTFGIHDDLLTKSQTPVLHRAAEKRTISDVLSGSTPVVSPPIPPKNPLEFFNYDTYDEKDPWIQGNWHHNDEDYETIMGEVLPPHKCFGCRFLNPEVLGKKSVAVDNTRLTQFVTNMSQAAGSRYINQVCLSLAEEYKKNIQLPHNKYCHEGQVPLPDWSAATIKKHITHHEKNPFFRILKIEEQLDDFADAAYAAAPEIHPIKRNNKGDPLTRVNPEQWKIYKEAIQEQHRWLFSNVKVMVGARDDMRNYLKTNGSDFVNPAQKNIYYHVDQMQHPRQGLSLRK